MNKKTFLKKYKDEVFKPEPNYFEMIDKCIEFMDNTNDMNKLLSGFLFLREIKHKIGKKIFQDYLQYIHEGFIEKHFDILLNSSFCRIYRLAYSTKKVE